MKRKGLKAHDPHTTHDDPSHTTHGLHISEPSEEALSKRGEAMDSEESIGATQHDHSHNDEGLSEKAMAQIIGVRLLFHFASCSNGNANSILFAGRFARIWSRSACKFFAPRIKSVA